MHLPHAVLLLFYIPAFVLGEDPPKHGEEESKEMGPIGFLWPPDREWGAAQDNTAPCGSAAGVSNRIEFPLLQGALALVIQDDSSNVQVSISYKDDPTSNDDFKVLIEPKRIKDVDPGHECYPIPDPPRDTEDGANATLQIKYEAQFDHAETETFYACADIKYVSVSKFDTQVPCFNVTSDEFIAPDPSSTAQPGSNPKSGSDMAVGPERGLSGGAIAGIAIGVLAGVVLIVLSYFGYRKYHQRRRIRLHQLSVRNVKWDDVGNPVSGK
ncbi:hypothetical protein FQN49_006924 [Arthroderma sp. PD_2]|nr:hypothetical protein FQN49_006924 [Arthroderma sp. PD_2]